MSKNKIIFLAATGGCVLLLILGFFALSSMSKNNNSGKGPKEFNIWVVRDETAGYSDIITGFKTKFPKYSNTEIKVKQFSSYSDYEKTLLTVMGDNNSPDVFVVNNNGGILLEQKVIALPDGVININDFSNRFNKVFDELVFENKGKDKDGLDTTVSYLKGIPMGFETLGVFYNWKLVKNISSTWSGLDDEIKSNAEKEDYATIGLGLGGKYIFNAPDIFSLLLLQKNVDSYSRLNDAAGVNSLSAYFSYASDPDNKILALKSEMDELNLTTVDLFVRGKIGMIIGYPSLLKEIELAVKRAGNNTSLDKKTLKSSQIFQVSSGEKDKNIGTNIVNYNYFAVSKLSKNPEIGYDFLSYLATEDAQEKYMKSFIYYLPALKELEEQRLSQSVDDNYERVKYNSFLQDGVDLKSFDKGLKTEYENYLKDHLNDNPNQNKKSILDNVIKYINCNKNHFINMSGFDEECK